MLELAQIVAGPFCGTLMAEFGAEVIKTEMPGLGDDLRRLGPSEDGHGYWFAVDNRNKRLMTLDMRTLYPGGPSGATQSAWAWRGRELPRRAFMSLSPSSTEILL